MFPEANKLAAQCQASCVSPLDPTIRTWQRTQYFQRGSRTWVMASCMSHRRRHCELAVPPCWTACAGNMEIHGGKRRSAFCSMWTLNELFMGTKRPVQITGQLPSVPPPLGTYAAWEASRTVLGCLYKRASYPASYSGEHCIRLTVEVHHNTLMEPLSWMRV